jgi:hypothetical protein
MKPELRGAQEKGNPEQADAHDELDESAAAFA